VSPMRYELGFHIQGKSFLHSRRHENLKSYIVVPCVNRVSVNIPVRGL
jgi:hypothetical protein